ncbi:MAG: antitoxin [Thermoproteus sp.]
MGGEVISIRVRKGLKGELEELGMDYAGLVREFLEEVVRREKTKMSLRRAEEIRRELAARGPFRPTAELVREDRDEAGG